MAGTSLIERVHDSMELAARTWWSPFWVSGDISVALVDLRPDAGREQEALTWLDSVERARWEEYRPTPRRRFILCRAALRVILCGELDCRNEELSFVAAEYGKPYALIAGQPAAVSFNVSHSSRHGLIALASSGAGRPGVNIGVDIEDIGPRRHLKSLIEAVMTPAERAELAALTGPERLRQFYRFWTGKEALVKALGDGFSTDVSRLELPEAMRRGAKSGVFRFPHRPEQVWRLADLGGEEFAATLVWEAPPETGQTFVPPAQSPLD